MNSQNKKKHGCLIALAVAIILGVIGAVSREPNSNESLSSSQSIASSSVADSMPDNSSSEIAPKSESEKNELNFNISKVRNDVTGNWRVATIAEDIQPEDYALDYYKTYFESDSKVHGIINFNYNTTTKISVVGNLLDVTVYEYVDKEEHDAKLLFSGQLLEEYFINLDTGEITKN